MYENIVYGSSLTAGGNIHIGNKYYTVERDFACSLLFLQINANASDFELMLSAKTESDEVIPLLREIVKLTIPDQFFEQVDAFQSTRRSSSELMRRNDSNNVSPEAIETSLAQQLYETFFTGGIGQVCRDFLELLQRRKINELLLIIASPDERIQNLPWEMVLPQLGPGDELPRDNFGLIRTRETSIERFSKQGPTASIAPLKLLFIPALPENLAERSKLLEIEKEQKKIIEAVRGLEATGSQQPRLVMEILDCAHLEEIISALQNHHHDIVHISGHGAYVESVRQGMLYLENEDGDEQLVSGKELGKALRRFGSIKLLVLSACETAVGGSEGSTAEQMAAVGLPAVLAMRFAVTDEGARLFTETLYERLAYGDTLTKAMHDARQTLWEHVVEQRKTTPQLLPQAEWFTPVLYQNQVVGSLAGRGTYDSDTLNRFYPPLAFLGGNRLVGEGFIGRKRLLIRIRKGFDEGEAICLHGLGGLGKTTTAEAAADLYRRRHGHDILMFRTGEVQEAVILNRLLEKAKTTTRLSEFLIKQLEERVNSPQTTPEQKLQYLITSYLSTHPTILIFDNVEDIQTGPSHTISTDELRTFLEHLLKNLPEHCPVLFTTRYTIPDLASWVTHVPIDKMTYAEQYRYINYSDTLRKLPVDGRAILDRRIDGHPRALELLEGLLRRDRRFDLSRFDASVGQVEVQIFENLLLKRLFEQLTDTERTVLMAAGILFSRSPLAALEAILDQPVDSFLSIVEALRDSSLCFYDEAEQTVEVHALTRAWLQQQGYPEPERRRELSARAGQYFEKQATYNDYWLAKDYFEQAEAWENYANVAFRLNSYYQLVGLYITAEQLNQDVLRKDISPELNSQALNGLGLIGLYIGDYETALSYLQDSLRIRQQIGDKHGEGATLNNISQIYDARGDYETTLSYLQDSLRIRQQIGDKHGEGVTLNNLATTAYAKGDYETALSYLQDSLRICQQIGDKNGEGKILNNISQIYDARGDYETALSYLQDSLRICQQIGDKKGEGTLLNNISQIYHARGDYETTLSYLQDSLRIRQQIGDKNGEGTTLNNISQIYDARGDYETALSYLQDSLRISQQIGDKNGEGTTINNMGALYWEQYQDAEKALPLLWYAYLIRKQLGSPKANNTIQYLNNIFEQIGEERFNQIIQSMQTNS
ncbi:tetratricopeptide repeat protein [Spirosoma litoris]